MISPERKARFIWQSRRGMLELDIILGRFIEKRLDQLNPEQVELFEALLHCTDPEVFSWLMGHERPKDKGLMEIVDDIRSVAAPR